MENSFGGASVDLDVEIHGEGSSVKGWAEIGGRGGEREAEARAASDSKSWMACLSSDFVS